MLRSTSEHPINGNDATPPCCPPHNTSRTLHPEAGFSLTELLVVLVIIGILALLAIPRFLNVTTKAKTSEAKLMLRNVHTLQQTYYFEHDRYAPDLLSIGFEQRPLIPDGGNAYYQIEVVSAEGNQFIARATSVVDFDNDGNFNVWEIDQNGLLRETLRDDGTAVPATP